jgi:uncharacterized membrane protein YhaH (DUF805 family)
MSETSWYYARDNKEQGPIGEAQLVALVSEGVIGPKTLVWTDGMADWQDADAALPGHLRPAEWGGAVNTAPPPPRPQAQMPTTAQPAPGSHTFANSAHPTGFADSVKAVFSRYATFTGRARRPEFWWFTLFSFLSNIAVTFVEFVVFGYWGEYSFLSTLYSFALFIPSLAVGARRLHDIGKSGWWQLIVLIPLIGWIILIIWFAKKGDEAANAYGPA